MWPGGGRVEDVLLGVEKGGGKQFVAPRQSGADRNYWALKGVIFALRWRLGSLMVWVVPSKNWSVANPVCSPVTVSRWNPRSRGVPLSLLPNLLYCGAGLVARNRTWTFSSGGRGRGGRRPRGLCCGIGGLWCGTHP